MLKLERWRGFHQEFCFARFERSRKVKKPVKKLPLNLGRNYWICHHQFTSELQLGFPTKTNPSFRVHRLDETIDVA